MFGLFNRTPSMTTSELEQKLQNKITLLDVRSNSEFQRRHISTAKNIPLEKVANYKGNQKEPVYVICQSGMRSKKACSILKANGYDVVNIRGGMNQWRGKVRGGK